MEEKLNNTRDDLFIVERILKSIQGKLGREVGARELAVSITNIQTARMWLHECLYEMGYYNEKGHRPTTEATA